jgi:hypothetical protein
MPPRENEKHAKDEERDAFHEFSGQRAFPIGRKIHGRRVASVDYANVTARLTQMRHLNAAGFGITEAFLDWRTLTVPLCTVPLEGNPFRGPIETFERLPYYVCPIDFCVTLAEALREIQNIASRRSFDYLSQKGQVSAKRDHLLCLDELVDVSTVVFLLANPVPTIGLVLAFEPYIQGLEMTSDLDFAFTNISAIARHILDLNMEEFMQAARAKAVAAMEIDPLLGK